MIVMNIIEKLDIWTIIGVLFIVYGLIILASGIYYIYVPPANLALAHLHPSIWWGSLMIVIGIALSYRILFRRHR